MASPSLTKLMRILIEKLVFGGDGFGRMEDARLQRCSNFGQGRPIFVSKAVPKDIVDVKIIEDKKNYSHGVIEKILKPSPDRIKPICPYFEQCGGCDHQNISYQNQLKYKDEIFLEVLKRAKVKIKPEKIIAGSNHPFYYRNSIRFFFILDKNKNIHFGRHNFSDDSKFVIVDFCMLQSEIANKILATLKNHINKNVLYKSSFWQLKIREGKRTGDMMIEIITSDGELPGQEGIIKVLKNIKGIRSIYHTIAPGKSLLNLKRRLIFGSPIIYEKIGGFTFQISPESFFQTNSEGVKTLYDKIKEFADIQFGDEIVDLYCGTGSIGIYLSTLAKKVIGIEVIPEAIRDAADNAKINKIKNCEFINTDAARWIKQNKPGKFSKIIIDPPRAGLKKDSIFDISHSDFDILLYVSCNPSTFARDLKYFADRGIITQKIQPIDMFPQTHHIECVGLLLRK